MNKKIEELSFNEYLDWSAGYFLISLGSGKPLKEIIHMIIICVCENKIFGGKKSI